MARRAGAARRLSCVGGISAQAMTNTVQPTARVDVTRLCARHIREQCRSYTRPKAGDANGHGAFDSVGRVSRRRRRRASKPSGEQTAVAYATGMQMKTNANHSEIRCDIVQGRSGMRTGFQTLGINGGGIHCGRGQVRACFSSGAVETARTIGRSDSVRG